VSFLRDRFRPRPYRHQRPKRPPRLAFRREPPPERRDPPDMSWFLYAGIILAIVVVVLAIPYLIQYLVEIMSA
jgi:hypothetical protein